MSLNRVGTAAVFAGALALFAGPLAIQASAQTVEGRGAEITIGGRLHAQYAQTSVEDGPPKDLFFRRIRLTMDIKVNDYLDGRVQPEFAGGGTAVQDAYFRLRLSPSFRVAVGQFKRAFDLFGLESSTRLPLIERDGRVPGLSACEGVGGTCSWTRLSEKLNFSGRDTGVRIDGALGDRASYLVTVTNGEGVNTRDENQGKSFSARVAFDAGDKVEIGVGAGAHDVLDPEAVETNYAPVFGVDAKIGSYGGGPMLMAGVMRGENWKAEDASGAFPTFWAGQVTGTYFAGVESDLIEGIEPVLRVSVANPNTDADDVRGLLFTPGVHVYIEGRNRVGVNLDVFSPGGMDTEYSLKFMTYLYF